MVTLQKCHFLWVSTPWKEHISLKVSASNVLFSYIWNLISVLFRLYLVKFDLNPELLLPIDFNVATNKRSVAAREIKNYYFKWFPVSLSTMQLMRVF